LELSEGEEVNRADVSKSEGMGERGIGDDVGLSFW
jgi:hypothetical protein